MVFTRAALFRMARIVGVAAEGLPLGLGDVPGRSCRTGRDGEEFPGALTVIGRGLTRLARLAFCFWRVWSIDVGCREDVP